MEPEMECCWEVYEVSLRGERHGDVSIVVLGGEESEEARGRCFSNVRSWRFSRGSAHVGGNEIRWKILRGGSRALLPWTAVSFGRPYTRLSPVPPLLQCQSASLPDVSSSAPSAPAVDNASGEVNMHRQAALAKFREKRKIRNFDRKVRRCPLN